MKNQKLANFIISEINTALSIDSAEINHNEDGSISVHLNCDEADLEFLVEEEIEIDETEDDAPASDVE